MARIYRASDEAISGMMDWDEIFEKGEIVTVQEFDSYEDAVAAFDEGGYDEDLYGVE